MKPWRTLYNYWQQRQLTDPQFRFLFQRKQISEEIICLDTETTSLDTAHAEILTIGAVPILHNRIILSRSLKMTVRPSGDLNPDSIKIHGLRPCDVRRGVPVEEAIRQLLWYIGNRPLLGYYLEFDLAIINRMLKRMLNIRLPNECLELSGLYHDKKIGLIPTAPLDLRFDAIRTDLGVPELNKHDALEDAIMTAMMYIRLQHLK
jgi:DNA polymerase-3 subunit epsilon